MVENTAMFGNNDKVIDYANVQSCKKACLQETEFACMSFDFVDGNSCFLRYPKMYRFVWMKY